MKLVTLPSPNLYRVAAEELGDATKWVQIAQLNGVHSPFLKGLVTLRLPDPAKPGTDGLPE